MAIKDGNNLGSLLDTARLHAPADEEEAAQRANRRLLALGNMWTDEEDIAIILGLLPAPPKPQRKPVNQSGSRACPVCEKSFSSIWPRQQTCSRSCGSALAARTRRAADGGEDR